MIRHALGWIKKWLSIGMEDHKTRYIRLPGLVVIGIEEAISNEEKTFICKKNTPFLYHLIKNERYEFLIGCRRAELAEKSKSTVISDKNCVVSTLTDRLAVGTPLVEATITEPFHSNELDRLLTNVFSLVWRQKTRDYDVLLHSNGWILVPPGKKALLESIGRQESLAQLKLDSPFTSNESLRVASYNIHSGIGVDGQYSLSRTARTIETLRADIVCLQEVDVGRKRTNFDNQAKELGRFLDMYWCFGSASTSSGGHYGNAVLSKEPLEFVQNLPLNENMTAEPRAALWVRTRFVHSELNVLNTHFGLLWSDADKQGKLLLQQSNELKCNLTCKTILCGDFNLFSIESFCRDCSYILDDVQKRFKGQRMRTFTSKLPILDLDHILISKEFKVRDIEVPKTRLSQIASDHLPLVAELTLE